MSINYEDDIKFDNVINIYTDYMKFLSYDEGNKNSIFDVDKFMKEENFSVGNDTKESFISYFSLYLTKLTIEKFVNNILFVATDNNKLVKTEYIRLKSILGDELNTGYKMENSQRKTKLLLKILKEITNKIENIILLCESDYVQIEIYNRIRVFVESILNYKFYDTKVRCIQNTSILTPEAINWMDRCDLYKSIVNYCIYVFNEYFDEYHLNILKDIKIDTMANYLDIYNLFIKPSLEVFMDDDNDDLNILNKKED